MQLLIPLIGKYSFHIRSIWITLFLVKMQTAFCQFRKNVCDQINLCQSALQNYSMWCYFLDDVKMQSNVAFYSYKDILIIQAIGWYRCFIKSHLSFEYRGQVSRRAEVAAPSKQLSNAHEAQVIKFNHNFFTTVEFSQDKADFFRGFLPFYLNVLSFFFLTFCLPPTFTNQYMYLYSVCRIFVSYLTILPHSFYTSLQLCLFLIYSPFTPVISLLLFLSIALSTPH